MKKWHLSLWILAVCISLVQSVRLSWVCDDAYFSYIYARNFYEGKGLIFQEGERVEGISNFFWTLLLSLSYLFQMKIEHFSMFLGIVFYISSLFAFGNPYLAFSYSLFPLGWEFATSGLETSLYTFLLLFSYLLWKRKNADGLLYVSSILPLVRPDGALFAIGNIFIFLSEKRGFGEFAENFSKLRKEFICPRRDKKISCVLFFLSLFNVVLFAGKCIYYGDLFPNTYYAKVESHSYFTQGLTYIYVFFKEYPVYSIFLVSGIIFSTNPYSWLILIYLAYVVYIGGDFMFARFLIPIIPLSMIFTWDRLNDSTYFWIEKFPKFGKIFSKIILIFFLLSPLYKTGYFTNDPLRSLQTYKISYERKIYQSLGKYSYYEKDLEGFRVAFYGAQAHFVYYLQPSYALEAIGGLTDPVLARMKPETRGMVGHEKLAPFSYLKEKEVEIVMGDIYEELREKGRDLYYDWNGNHLHWKVIHLSPEKFQSLKNHPRFDTSSLDPRIWLDEIK